MENRTETVYEEPEIVDANQPSPGQADQANEPQLFKKLIGTVLVGLGVFILITGLFVWFVFWILFAILPDVVAYILLGLFAGIMLFNAVVWLSKIGVMYGRYKSGRDQFNAIKNNMFK